MASFPTNPLPDYALEESAPAPEVLISKFRNGSEQRRWKGQGTGRTFRLSFGTSAFITNAQREAIYNHHAGQDGSTLSFNWTHPERGEVIVCRYAEPPSFTHIGYNAYRAQVVLQEVPA